LVALLESFKMKAQALLRYRIMEVTPTQLTIMVSKTIQVR